MKRSVVHAVAAALIVGPLALAYFGPERYDLLMEEDRAVEWATVVLFAAAGIVRVHQAARARRAFDALVGVFCLFVAGEEISWGQRLFGYTPPDLFLEHNTQQEANVHNFAEIFGRPKWMLITALAGYSVLLPVFGRRAPTRRLLDRVGATPPALTIVPWFLAAIALLVWYPVIFTGEWVELLSGWLFLTAAAVSPLAAGFAAAATIPVALAMTWLSAARRSSDAAEVACARIEVRALLDDLLVGEAATSDLAEMSSVHKRVWSSIESGYVDGDRLGRFRAAQCGGASSGAPAPPRRRYGVDPWGTAYWLQTTREPESDGQRVVVYSFGPNRRRDGTPGGRIGDDISAEGLIR